MRLYELATIYIPKELPLAELPDGRQQFTLGMYGSGDFYTMKGVVEEFFDKIGMKKSRIIIRRRAKHSCIRRQAEIIYDGTSVGYLGKSIPMLPIITKLGEKTYVAVLDMPSILPNATFDHKYTGIAKYPAVTRDISMVMKKEILAGQVEDIIEQRGGKILESYKLFDYL